MSFPKVAWFHAPQARTGRFRRDGHAEQTVCLAFGKNFANAGDGLSIVAVRLRYVM
jgi:hypothetical protein